MYVLVSICATYHVYNPPMFTASHAAQKYGNLIDDYNHTG